MKVCVVGGGNIGTTLACYIKHFDPYKEVYLLTREPHLFSNPIKCNDIENEQSYYVTLDGISNHYELVGEAEIIFVALPHFAVEEVFAKLAGNVSKHAFIGVIPGGGGCEFFFDKYFDTSNTLFGFQRVPFTAKLVKYGKETNLKSWKDFSVVGTQKRDRIDEACQLIEVCGLKTQKASNYLEIALTPTNPLLHTSRIYDIFHKFPKEYVFKEKSKFYVGWNNKTSEILFGMDAELHALLECMTELKTDAIRPLSEHYESHTIEQMTKKINHIPTFQSVYAPLKECNGGYIADLSSRMFTEDFPWGLALIRSYFILFDLKAPMMDVLLKWYSQYIGLEWFSGDEFCGNDLSDTGVLGRYGITTKELMYQYYLR